MPIRSELEAEPSTKEPVERGRFTGSFRGSFEQQYWVRRHALTSSHVPLTYVVVVLMFSTYISSLGLRV